MSKSITAVSKVVTKEAIEAVTNKLQHNIWALPSRTSPNAEQLKDGAIQRMAVAPNRYALHVKENPEKIGFVKREEQNERASRSAYPMSNVWDNNLYKNKIARIYQP